MSRLPTRNARTRHWRPTDYFYNAGMTVWDGRRLMILFPLLAGMCAAPAGCRATGGERMTSTNPYERAQATVRRADAGDPAAIDGLVALLEDEDPAVRMYAILALQRLVGTDHGYHYYGNAAERAAAVQRWQEALQRGEIVITARPGAGAADSSNSTRSTRKP